MNPFAIWACPGPLVARSRQAHDLPQAAHLSGDGHYVITHHGIVLYRVVVQGDQVHVG